MTVVEGVPQIVPVDENNKQPNPENSIDKTEYPDGSIFEYKTPVDTTTPGEKDVVVVAKDGDDTLVEVPAKVKVVEGKAQVVSKGVVPNPKKNINPSDYPEGVVFEYKDNPDTSTTGDKKVIVVVKRGDKVLVEVPAIVTVVEQNLTPSPLTPNVKIVTRFIDENGKDISTSEEGVKEPKVVEGYEFTKTTIDENGNKVHHYKRVVTPQHFTEVPETPSQHSQSAQPNQPAVPTPAEPSVPTDSATQPATPKYVDGQKELPNTGTEANASLAALGLLGVLGGFGLLARKKKED